MSQLSVTKILTQDGLTDLTITTGNTSSGSITVYANGGFNFSSNSTTNVITSNSSGALTINPTYISISNNYLSPFPTFRNKVINGDMRIDQRYAGAFLANVATTSYLIDRYLIFVSNASHINSQQNANASVSGPNGFTNYLGFTVSNSYTSNSTDYFYFEQRIEGLNVADFAWGSASAQTITLSFYAYSNITNTNFSGSLVNSSQNLSYPFSYSIPVANTWTYNSITIPGPTSGVWYSNSSIGTFLRFNLGTGNTYLGTTNTWSVNNFIGSSNSASIMGANGNILYITGVQLEKGTKATPYEFLPYGTQLSLCQRYYWRNSGVQYQAYGSGACINTTDASAYVQFPNTMRVIPTMTQFNTLVYSATGGLTIVSTINPVYAGLSSAMAQCITSGLIVGQGAMWMANSGPSYIDASAEL